MNFTIYGPFRGLTGYDYLVRNVIEELHNQGHNVQTIEFERWSNTRGPTEIDHILEKTCNANLSPDIHLNFCLLDQTKLNPHISNMAYTMFEADRICDAWVDCASRLEKIIVPTEWNRQTFAKSGSDAVKRIPMDKLEVCPIPININKIVNGEADFRFLGYDGLEFIKDYKHVFLNVSEYIPRKNVENLIRAWIDETKPEDNACLLIKLNSNFGFKLEFFNETLQSLMKQKKCAPIYFLGDFLTERQMLALYRSCTHYITCSYGEGWGLSESICGILGKRLIVPKSTAFSSYLDDSMAYMTMVQSVVASQTGPTMQYYLGSQWYAPVMFSVRKLIRQSIKDANANDTLKTVKVSEHLKKICDQTTVVNKLVDIAQNIESSAVKTKVENGIAYPRQLPKVNNPKEMNVGLICKSIGSKCGIADYATALYECFNTDKNKEKMQACLAANGDAMGYRAVLDANDLHAVNLQLEYQFISPSKLAYLCSYCKSSNIKLFVTLHTVNPRCYDYHAPLIQYGTNVIVCSQVMADCLVKRCGFDADKVKVIPMGISKECVVNPLKKSPGSFRIGFFGFGYQHKGIDRIIRYMREHGDGKDALILSTKPTNDQGYFDKAFNQVKDAKNVRWLTDHLSEAAIARGLSSCDLIFLPYSEYGGLATSAAIRTCLKAGVPIVAFDTCFFRDVVRTEELVEFIGTNPNNYEEWSTNLNLYIENMKGNELFKAGYVAKRDSFLEKYSWNNVAGMHLDHFYEVCSK